MTPNMMPNMTSNSIMTPPRQVTIIPATREVHSAAIEDTAVKKRVAAYARVSTDKDDQQTSYDTQVTYYTRYIQEREDWVFVKIYADEGLSGLRMTKREAFKTMIADALAGKIDLIITKSVSRFARNTVDSLTTIRKLKEHGVECYFEKENIWTMDSKGELLLTIMSSIAQEESRSTSENVRWGKRKAMADGRYSVAYSKLLGYKKGPKGGLVIDEEQAVLVRRIFSLYLQGHIPSQIAKILTAEKILTVVGKQKWTSHTVLSILRNEKYKGDVLLQKFYYPDFLTKKQVRNHGEVQQYYVKDSHEAIVSPEVFDHVQRLLTMKKSGKRQNRPNLLSTKIICGDCGGTYGSKVWHSTDKYRRVIWQCNDKFQGVKCSTPHLTEEQVKELFIKAVNLLLDKRRGIIATYERIITVELDTAELEKKQRIASERLIRIEEENAELITQNATLVLDEEIYKAQHDEILARYEETSKELQELNAKINDMVARRETIRRFWHEFEKLEPVTEFDNILWISLLDEMIVYSKERIVFVFRDGSEVEVTT
ncbi:MAG: Transposon gamma-delta resolvase [Firmicutes bacterium ADurb.BinA205]|nr:MAG: Transposon gamma-delta resolvase [Firmicutes bacterium ADurb.BinA205]